MTLRPLKHPSGFPGHPQMKTEIFHCSLWTVGDPELASRSLVMPFSASFTPLCYPSANLLTVPTVSHARDCLTYCAAGFSKIRKSTSLICWHTPSALFNCYLLRDSFLHLICCVIVLHSLPHQPFPLSLPLISYSSPEKSLNLVVHVFICVTPTAIGLG